MKTTEEMDGIFTEEDRKNKYTVMFQCRSCRAWTKHVNWTPGGKNTHIPCTKCEQKNYDGSSIKSFRSYNPQFDSKRKIK